MVRKLSEAVQEAGSGNVDPSVIQACLAEYTTVDSEIKRLAQRQAAMLGRYEKQGVNVKAVKNAHKMGRQDKAAARAQVQTDVRYLVITGILKPADDEWVKQVSQSSLFTEDEDLDAEVSPLLVRARAHSDGYNSGKHGGEPINNPFQAGTEAYVSWEAGRRDGRADLALRPGKGNVKKANTDPTRGPGRPKGSRNRATDGEAAHA